MTGFGGQWELGNVWDGTGMSKLETTVGSAIWRSCSEFDRKVITDISRTSFSAYTRRIENSPGKQLWMPGTGGNRSSQSSGSYALTEPCAGLRRGDSSTTQPMATPSACSEWR